jgi:hypothetical protein
MQVGWSGWNGQRNKEYLTLLARKVSGKYPGKISAVCSRRSQPDDFESRLS